MDYKILNDAIIITPTSNNKFFYHIKSIYPELNFKLYDKKTFFNEIKGKYNELSLVYLHNCGLSYENASEAIEYLFDLQDGISENVDKLNKYQKDLLSQGYLKKNALFLYELKNRKIILYGYSKFDLDLINELEKNNLKYQIEEAHYEGKTTLYKYKTIEMEVIAFFNHVFELVNNGKRIEDICLIEPSNDYFLLIKKYAAFYNIPINLFNNDALDVIPSFQSFINDITIDNFENNFTCYYNESPKELQQSLEQLLGNYLKCKDKLLSDKDLKEYLSFKASTIKLRHNKYLHGINLAKIDDIDDSKIYFILGFNIGTYPIIHQDQLLLSDDELEKLGKMTSKDKNDLEHYRILNFIKNHDCIISYKELISKTVFYPSLLIHELNLGVIKDEKSKYYFSEKELNYRIAKAKDDDFLYGIKNGITSLKADNVLKYKEYDHKFKKLKTFKIDKLALSYSSLDEFNNCAFKYYINHILKIEPFEENFNLKFGNLFHKILEKSITNPNIDIDKLIEEQNFSQKELVFIDILKPQIKASLEFNQKLMEHTSLQNVEAEKKVTIKYNDGTLLVGKIDKIMCDDKSKKVIIIDYKTGSEEFSEKYVPLGFKLQLPIYYLFAKYLYNDYDVVGLFINQVANFSIRKDNFDYLKLKGIVSNDKKDISLIDRNYPISSIINGVKVKNDGNLYDSKSLYSLSKIALLGSVAKSYINKASKEIKEGRFIINPKRIDEKELACTKCDFKDICFADYLDYVDLSTKEEKEG